jgi:hypothetical protein
LEAFLSPKFLEGKMFLYGTNVRTYTRKPILTLSYSPTGSPARAVQASLSLNCLMITVPGFPYHLISLSCGDIGFKEKA